MKVIDFENKILFELKTVIESIIQKYSSLNISAKSRAGAEISSFLESEFVKETKDNQFLKKSEASPSGATKNPWDVMTFFCINGHEELLWIDFKAVKVSSVDSNPDIGTPDKIFNLIINGYFYLVYIFVYYEEEKDGLKFVKNREGEFVKIYFLKDISSTFRRNPKNQLQVNISAIPEKRTREEFINLLIKKIEESHRRQIHISEKALNALANGEIKTNLIKLNDISESKIKKI